jgi:hypothetical protein
MFDRLSFLFSSTLILALAGVAAVVVLAQYCKEKLFDKHATPLPPGPPASWFWESAMPSNKSVAFVHHVHD